MKLSFLVGRKTIHFRNNNLYSIEIWAVVLARRNSSNAAIPVSRIFYFLKIVSDNRFEIFGEYGDLWCMINADCFLINFLGCCYFFDSEKNLSLFNMDFSLFHSISIFENWMVLWSIEFSVAQLKFIQK